MLKPLFALLWLGLLACAAPQRNLPLSDGEALRDVGGELRVADLPPGSVEYLGDTLAVWGLTEVPDGSRMQAAFAMVDAITRAELINRVQVSVAESALDIVDQERQLIERGTAEALQAKLPGLSPIAHGWERIERNGQVVLRLAGRLHISRAELAPVVLKAFGAEQRAAAEALLRRLFPSGAGE